MTKYSETALATPADDAVVARSNAPLFVALAVVGIFFLVNFQILQDWRIYSFDDGTYSHAYLIPFMSAFVLYTGWQRGGVQLAFSWWFGLALIACLLAYQWLDVAHQRFLSRTLVPLCLAVALLTVMRASRYVVGSAALFWFVAPVWGPVNELLQWSSIHAVATIMGYTGIPTFVYAEYVQIPAGTFEIADGCSGLRYVIAILALVSFYSVLYLRSYRSILVLTLVALLGAMLTNWLRIVALILIGHFTDMQSPMIADHNMFGWFLFVPILLVIFPFADRMESASSQTSQAGSFTPQPSTSLNSGANSYLPLVFVTIVLVICSGMTVRLMMDLPAFALDNELDVAAAEPLALPLEPGPTIFAAKAISAAELPAKEPGVIYKISFSGATDAERAEFFLNEMIPEQWNTKSSRDDGAASELVIEKGGRLALLRYSYRIGSVWAASKGAIRGARLSAALRLDRSSELAWGLVYCDLSCGQRERNALSSIGIVAP